MARMTCRQAGLLLAFSVGIGSVAVSHAETIQSDSGSKQPSSGHAGHGTQSAAPSQKVWPRLRPDTAASPIPAWTKADMDEGRARCNALLAKLDVVVVPADPVREGDCGTPAPVQLISIGRSPQVSLSAPMVMTCDMVVALHNWMKSDVQPAARELLGSQIVRIEVMSGYSCRNAYGRKKTRLSEHGRANAVDIRAFVAQSGETVEVLNNWGPTERDAKARIAAAAAAAKIEAARLDAIKRDAEKSQAKFDTARAKTPVAPQAAAKEQVVAQEVPVTATEQGAGKGLPGILRDMSSPGLRGSIGEHLLRSPQPAPGTLALTPPAHLGGPKSGKHNDGALANGKSRFLHRVHAQACKSFGTVLGPEANEAHRNHFHLDMAERPLGNFCE